MTTTDLIFKQLDKKRFKQSPNQWTDPTAYKIENEFDDVDAIPFSTATPSTDDPINTRHILKQIKKKKLSNIQTPFWKFLVCRSPTHPISPIPTQR